MNDANSVQAMIALVKAALPNGYYLDACQDNAPIWIHNITKSGAAVCLGYVSLQNDNSTIKLETHWTSALVQLQDPDASTKIRQFV